MPREFKILKENLVYQDPYTTVHALDVAIDGNNEVFARMRHNPSCIIVPYHPKSKQIVLIQQHRFAVDHVVWEFPAGLIDAGETADIAAVREIREEIGVTHIERLVEMGTLQPNPPSVFQISKAYVAILDDQAIAMAASPEGEDQIVGSKVCTLSEFGSMIDAGDIISGVTLSVYGLFRRYLDTQGETV